MTQDVAAAAQGQAEPQAKRRARRPGPEIDRVWLTVEEASALTGVSVRELYDALRTGDLPGSQRTRNAKWRAHVDDIDAWMRQGQEKRR